METLQVGKLTVRIQQDDCPLNPREDFDNVGTMVCWHTRYSLGDVQPSCSPEEYLFEMMRDREFEVHRKFLPDEVKPEHVKGYINKHYFVLPIYMYDHGGVTLSTAPFGCPWDSGQLGFIYAKRDSEEYPDMLAGLEAEVRIYDQFLNGEIYGFDLIDETGEIVDSCFGFYGFEDCKSEALHIAQAYA